MSQLREQQLEEALRNLLAQIELFTDCMTGMIEVESLDDFIVEAEALVGPMAESEPGIFRFDLVAHLHRQMMFSEGTFGPGMRTVGVLDHIRKECVEIEAKPDDVSEWVDVILLALDGAWRSGASPEAIALAIATKQTTNESRQWPDWRTADPSKAIEHIAEVAE